MVTNKSLFRLNSDIHNFNTRNNSKFFQVTTHLNVFKKSPGYAGVKIYNHLPADIKDLADDVKSFKKVLKIICTFIHFILWMNFLCIKLDKYKYFDGNIIIIIVTLFTMYY
jgi:hypothetical protein